MLFWRVKVREIVAADLDGDARCDQVLGAHAGTGEIGQARKLGVQMRGVGDVDVESIFGADRFVFELGVHLALVDTCGAVAHALGIAAEDRPELRIGRGAQLPERADAERFDPRARLCRRGREAGAR